LTFDNTTLSIVGALSIGGAPNSNKYTVTIQPSTSLITSNQTGFGEQLKIGSTAGTTVGKCYYFDITGGNTWYQTDASAASTSKGLLGINTGSNAYLIRGYFRDDSYSFTVGGIIYLSPTTGSLTQTQPGGSGDIVRVVGYALTSSIYFFDPSQDWIELA
jgi:hypothetical protein